MGGFRVIWINLSFCATVFSQFFYNSQVVEGTYVNLWLICVDAWQGQHNIVDQLSSNNCIFFYYFSKKNESKKINSLKKYLKKIISCIWVEGGREGREGKERWREEDRKEGRKKERKKGRDKGSTERRKKRGRETEEEEILQEVLRPRRRLSHRFSGKKIYTGTIKKGKRWKTSRELKLISNVPKPPIKSLQKAFRK